VETECEQNDAMGTSVVYAFEDEDQLVKNLESVVAKEPELNFISKTDGNNALSVVRSNK
jgi:hypothetical protein